MKKYENPMLQVVSINKSDIIATSNFSMNYSTTMSDETGVGAADRFRDDWDAGY